MRKTLKNIIEQEVIHPKMKGRGRKTAQTAETGKSSPQILQAKVHEIASGFLIEILIS